MASLRQLETFQCRSALPNIKYNCAVLFLRQVYYLFNYAPKTKNSTEKKILINFNVKTLKCIFWHCRILKYFFWTLLRVIRWRWCSPMCHRLRNINLSSYVKDRVLMIYAHQTSRIKQISQSDRPSSCCVVIIEY